MFRRESDDLGEKPIPADALYGIHAARAMENFPDHTPFHVEWYRAMGMVKEACYLTYRDFRAAVLQKFPEGNAPLDLIPEETLDALIHAAHEASGGMHFAHFVVPGLSGGAGTSINMNMNEIIANTALIRMGKIPGEYAVVDPIAHANVFQSTNDVVPTALKVALMHLLADLEKSVNGLRGEAERLENAHRFDLRIGYTQMQEAVPSTYGRLFSSYSEALSRDWWRVSKCFERIKTVNLGGSAIGTGMAVPRFFIMEVVPHLQKLSGLPLARAENLADATSNFDSLAEIHATLKAHAVNLEKISSDIRLLSSDLSHHELSLPPRQVGSSVMPGKINPVIPEFVISASHKVYANDILVSSLCAQGCLELNAYLPAIGHAMIESLKLLIAAGQTMQKNLLEGLTVNTRAGEERLLHSPSLTTALLPWIGYHKAAELAKEMKASGSAIYEANKKLGLMDEAKLREILKPENLVKLGYTLGDLGD
jgi:aspartate ammonia-lyase